MRIKGSIKYEIFNRRGYFNYFGQQVFFPKDSLIFKMACEEGIYDATLLNYIKHFLKPGTTFFDVGTNIGLISMPVLLDQHFNGKVVSVEPTPAVLEHLRKTREQFSGKDRWTIIERAVADFNGEVDFSVKADLDSAYYGVSAAGDNQKIRIKCNTLDEIWTQVNKPDVSVIKIDIEGYDFFALKGGAELIKKCRPVIFIEWFEEYITKYGLTHKSLLDLCKDYGYSVVCIKSLHKVSSSTEMKLHQRYESNFILIPDDL